MDMRTDVDFGGKATVLANATIWFLSVPVESSSCNCQKDQKVGLTMYSAIAVRRGVSFVEYMGYRCYAGRATVD